MALTLLNLVNQVKGILGIANGGTGQTSFSAGLLRSSGSALSSAELSGDATTSTSNAVTVAKINGTSVPTTTTTHQVLVTTDSATGGWKTLADCAAGGLALTYNATTKAFGSIAVIAGTPVYEEVPTGDVDGENDDFTLAHTPAAGSLRLYKNGQRLIGGGADYTLATATITYTAGAIPAAGDVHVAEYVY
jgi:hypothetical protein